MSEEEVRTAIGVIRKALAEDYIVEDCRKRPSVGCASCEMIALDRQLEILDNEYANFSPSLRRES